MFYLQYLIAELRRRPGRTALTALGLAVGVGLVVIVGALSKGLDDAQDEVLEPLTGVGTDLSVSRPLEVADGEASGASGPGADPFSQLSPREQRRLERENKEHDAAFDYSDLGEPGERFSEVSLLSSQLSFPTSEVAEIRDLNGTEDAAASLTLRALTVKGEVPESGEVASPHGPGGGFEFSDLTVSGVDVRKPQLAMVTPDQITEGRYLSENPKQARGEAVLDLAYARQNDIAVGDEIGKEVGLAGEEAEVVGLASAPLGGEASQAYVELGRLQELSDREGRVNRIQVRADSSEAVAGLAPQIQGRIEGAEVVTAADLADRVGGSLDDAENLSSTLGTALAIVALLAAFSIAALLTLASVQKRIRELGTLKALGWRQRLVVRQVTGESVVQGLLGGFLGAAVGIGGAIIIDAIGPTLEASVEEQSTGAFGSFGQGRITAGSTDVVLGAPVDPGLLVLAVGLAILGGLLAGAAGGLRAARLRPAEALRSAE
jgi:ABC-type antimicrobial peptide transport system permease subunit